MTNVPEDPFDDVKALEAEVGPESNRFGPTPGPAGFLQNPGITGI